MVIGAGEAVAWIDRDGRSVLTFVDDHSRWIDPLVDCASSGRMNRLEIVQIDGVAAGRHPAASLLVRAGFVDGYRGMRWVERP